MICPFNHKGLLTQLKYNRNADDADQADIRGEIIQECP